MRKPDEIAMMRAALPFGAYGQARPDDCFQSTVVAQVIHPKRLVGILYKWADRGWWEYGTRVTWGWLTPEGVKALEQIVASC